MSKWYAALLHIGITIAGGLGAAVAAPRDLSVWLQLAVIAAGSVVTYAVPLVNTKWQAALKVILGAALPAVIAAALPFIPIVGKGFDPQNILPLIVAVLAALGTQIGVDSRTAKTAPVIRQQFSTPTYATTVIGPASAATGNVATAIGTSALATGDSSTAIGNGTLTDPNSMGGD